MPSMPMGDSCTRSPPPRDIPTRSSTAHLEDRELDPPNGSRLPPRERIAGNGARSRSPPARERPALQRDYPRTLTTEPNSGAETPPASRRGAWGGRSSGITGANTAPIDPARTRWKPRSEDGGSTISPSPAPADSEVTAKRSSPEHVRAPPSGSRAHSGASERDARDQRSNQVPPRIPSQGEPRGDAGAIDASVSRVPLPPPRVGMSIDSGWGANRAASSPQPGQGRQADRRASEGRPVLDRSRNVDRTRGSSPPPPPRGRARSPPSGTPGRPARDSPLPMRRWGAPGPVSASVSASGPSTSLGQRERRDMPTSDGPPSGPRAQRDLPPHQSARRSEERHRASPADAPMTVRESQSQTQTRKGPERPAERELSLAEREERIRQRERELGLL